MTIAAAVPRITDAQRRFLEDMKRIKVVKPKRPLPTRDLAPDKRTPSGKRELPY